MDLRSAYDLDVSTASPSMGDSPGYAAREKTREGTFVGIRSIRDGDRRRLAEGFARFVDPATTALVATVWIEGCERIVGLSSFGRSGPESSGARVDVRVLEEWRDRGIESLLYTHLVRARRAYPARRDAPGCNPETDPVVLS